VKRLFRVAAVVGLLLLALGVVVFLAMRAGRGSYEPPLKVAAETWGVRSGGGIWLYAARAGREVLLFDTGADPQGRPVDGLLAALGAGRSEVTHVFLTHGHFDHTAAASLFPQARVHIGAGDAALAAGRERPEGALGRIFSVLMPVPPARVTDPIEGEVEIPVGEGRSVRAIPMPGHTPGSYAFLFDGVLLVGDTLDYRAGKLGLTPAFFDAHPEANRASVVALAREMEGWPFDTLCTGHGGCTAAGEGPRLLAKYAAP
jgi:glyoxylase-like metal-dependent hydrolase (beta-lactamase superfamily II)